ncbi:MAG TPA: hypothetical protein VL443_21635 [Cyclobacteriaceae bacterium]|nr:hypothetical protein [Cyclobacteriaceae bacterium]
MAKRNVKLLVHSKRKVYLTKRALQRATSKAGRTLSTEAMNIKGYVIRAENGWVVRINNDGTKERLKAIKEDDNHHSHSIVLD